MTASPTSSTRPAASSPKMAGSAARGWCGNQVGQLLITLAMLGTIPQALTRTRTSVGRGDGTSMVSMVIGSPIACSRAARIFAMSGCSFSCWGSRPGRTEVRVFQVDVEQAHDSDAGVVPGDVQRQLDHLLIVQVRRRGLPRLLRDVHRQRRLAGEPQDGELDLVEHLGALEVGDVRELGFGQARLEAVGLVVSNLVLRAGGVPDRQDGELAQLRAEPGLIPHRVGV